MRITTVALVLLLAVSGDEKSMDTVHLLNGQKIEGRVIYEDKALVVVRIGTRDREVPMKEVANVVSRAGQHREAMTRWMELEPTKLRAVLDLAAWCQRVDLVENAELIAWWVLAFDPRNEEAHALLGHQKQGGEWLVKSGTKRLPWSTLEKTRSNWNDAWELRTTHYRLRTNIRLRQAAGLALDLECFYRAFYDLFALDLKLYEIVEPLQAKIHADKKSFPEIVGSNGAYFDREQHTLIVDASSELDFGLVIHEATHQLLDASAVNTRVARGAIPAWLDEGLAEYMRYTLFGDQGRRTFDGTAVASHHFDLHASAKQPYDMMRVLTFEPADYLSSTRADLKYAQSYTLVHYLLHGHGRKYRLALMAFMRSAYKGQSSPTEFKAAFDVDDGTFEKEWTAYVQQMSGAGRAGSPR